MRTILVPLGLDHPLHPERGWPATLPRALPALLVLGAFAAVELRRERDPRDGEPGPLLDPGTKRRRLVALGLAWAVLGWLPVLWPSLGWHSYYTLLGALGAWLALAAVLAPQPRIAVAVVVALAGLRAAAATTPSLDWGSEWYQARSASFLRFMRGDLMRLHPTLPPRTRLFFTRVPSNVGFLTEGGPALRVWYGDSTLSGAFLSAYARRPVGARGEDRFFRFDSTRGWVEIAAGPEDVARARAANPRWLDDHVELAAALARANAWREAGTELAKVAGTEPERVDLAGDAAVCFAMAGDSVAAARWFDRAARSPSADQTLRGLAREFARHLRSPP